MHQFPCPSPDVLFGEIEVKGADDLYKEIRIENTLQDSKGKKVKLNKGAEVDVTIEADEKDTTPKSE
jgi:hypothetical protein